MHSWSKSRRRAVAQSDEFSVQRHVVQRLLHRWVRQVEPLLQEMDVQHRFDRAYLLAHTA